MEGMGVGDKGGSIRDGLVYGSGDVIEDDGGLVVGMDKWSSQLNQYSNNGRGL